MAEITEAAIERKARELAQVDGKLWQYEFTPPLPSSTQITLRKELTDAERNEYRSRARQELEGGNA